MNKIVLLTVMMLMTACLIKPPSLPVAKPAQVTYSTRHCANGIYAQDEFCIRLNRYRDTCVYQIHLGVRVKKQFVLYVNHLASVDTAVATGPYSINFKVNQDSIGCEEVSKNVVHLLLKYNEHFSLN